jgi:4-amino-4-deoxychorismate lyase
LFEAIQVRNGIVQNPAFHNARLNRSRRELFGSSDEINVESAISVPAEALRGTFKCRITYGGAGIESVEFAPYRMRSIAGIMLVRDDTIGYSHKYCDRDVFDRLMALRGECDDILIVRGGMITDTSFSNVVFHDGTRWITPATYLLPGTRRAGLLQKGSIIEKEIGIKDLPKFSRVSFINAMIDLGELTIDVKKIDGRHC